MRPPKRRQSAIRAPLHRILGAEGNVRLLRILALNQQPLTRTEFARRSGLEVPGAHLAANRLVKDGVLRTVGGGARQQVELEPAHPLMGAIKALFAAERDRVERIIEGLRTVAKALANDLDSAWIQGPFAVGEDEPGEPLIVGFLARTSSAGRLLMDFQNAVTPIEQTEDVTIETKPYTRADLATLRPEELKGLAEVVPVFGPPPFVFTQGARDPRGLRNNTVVHGDRESEQQAREIASRLRRDPATRRRAVEYI